MDLLKHIEQKFGKGPSSEWKHGDFEALSLVICRETKVRISSKTLKRIFGKDKTSQNYQPQEETLRLLSIYSGFDYEANLKPSKKTNKPWFLIILFVLVMGALSIYLLNKKEAPHHVSFEVIKSVGNTPTTVYFKLGAHQLKDSLFVDFGDKTPLKYISKIDSIISHIYSYPDHYKVVLRTRHNPVSDSISVISKTDGWKAFGFKDHSRNKVYPMPLEKALDSSGYFHPSNQTLKSSGIDINKFFLLGLYNYQKFSVSGDDFSLKTRVKSAEFCPETICRGIVIWVKCENGNIKQHFNNSGCNYWLDCQYSEVLMDGEKNETSLFSLDISKWHDVEIENKEQTIHIYIDGTKVFTQSYQNPLGNIIGVSFSFTGSGFVDYCYLSDKKGKDVLITDFNRI